MWRFHGCLLAMLLALAGCSGDGGGGTDGGDPAGSEVPAGPSDAAGDEERALDDEAAVGEGTDGADAEPGPLFTAHHQSELNPGGQRFDMYGAAADAEGSITLAGEFLDFDVRRRTARLVVAAERDTATVVDLPSDSSAAANAAAYRPDDVLVVGGWRTENGAVQPTLWLGVDGRFTVVELPVTGDGGWVESVAADGSAVVGTALVGGERIDTLWVDGPAGWSQVDVGPPPGAEDVTIGGVVRLGDGDLVAVGHGWSPGRDVMVTGFWDLDAATLTATWRVPDGMANDIVLTGVAAAADGGLVAVGGSALEEAEPVVYRVDEYRIGAGGTWSARSVGIDTGGRFNTDGNGLAAIEVGGERLVAWTWSPFTRQVIESSDGGRTWTQLGSLTNDAAGARAVSGGAVTADRVVVGAGHLIDTWEGQAWRRLSGAWSEAGEWTLGRLDVQGDGSDLLVAMMLDRSTTDDGIEQLRVMSSTDGRTWTADPVLAAGGRSTLVTAQSGERTWLFTTGTNFSRDPLNVWRFEGQQWVAANHVPGEPFIRSLAQAAVGAGDGGALIVAFDFNTERWRHVPKVVSSAGVVTDGDFGVARSNSLDTDIGCLERLGDTYVAVLTTADEPDLLLTSTDGLTWTTVAEGIGPAPVTGCHVIGDELLATTGVDEEERIIPMALDATLAAPLALPEGARVNNVAAVDGIRMAVGWIRVDGAETAALWWEAAGGWEQVALAGSGLVTDDFGVFSEAEAIRLIDDTVVVIGRDDVGVVVWTADRGAFAE